MPLDSGNIIFTQEVVQERHRLLASPPSVSVLQLGYKLYCNNDADCIKPAAPFRENNLTEAAVQERQCLPLSSPFDLESRIYTSRTMATIALASRPSARFRYCHLSTSHNKTMMTIASKPAALISKEQLCASGCARTLPLAAKPTARCRYAPFAQAVVQGHARLSRPPLDLASTTSLQAVG